jgi:DNA-binding transcriptional LysR family regulator
VKSNAPAAPPPLPSRLDHRHLDLRLLSQFLVVCESRSMAAAARKLGISTAAVSQAVLRLERDFGVMLFERSAQGLRTTPVGSLLREHASDLRRREIDILSAVAEYQAQTIPRLRLFLIESVASCFVPAFLPMLEKIVGDLTINCSYNHDFVSDFLRREFDILISADPLDDVPNLERHPICRETLVALFPSNVPPEARSPRIAGSRLPLVRVHRARRLDATIERYLKQQGLEPPRSIECTSDATILELIGRGLAWTITTPLSIRYLRPRADNIAWAYLEADAPARTISLIAEKDRLAGLPKALADHCRNALRSDSEESRLSFGDPSDALEILDPIRSREHARLLENHDAQR